MREVEGVGLIYGKHIFPREMEREVGVIREREIVGIGESAEVRWCGS